MQNVAESENPLDHSFKLVDSTAGLHDKYIYFEHTSVSLFRYIYFDFGRSQLIRDD